MRVLASGVFDLLHPGHIYFLEQSRRLGEKLFVVVTCDKVAKEQKRRPILPQIDRLKIVSSLKMVDKAVLGRSDNNIFKMIEEIKPNIIALGFDQKFDQQTLERDSQKRGFKIKVVRIPKKDIKHFASSAVIKKILERNSD